MSLNTGSWAYQPLNASLPPDLFGPLEAYGSERVNASFKRALHPDSATPREAVVRVSTKVELLRMNAVAVALSVAILAWLVVIAAVVSSVQRRYVKKLAGDVACLGDVLLLVCRSERLLRLVRDRGVVGRMGEEGEGVWTSLAWFDCAGGWGVEVVERASEGD